MKTLISIDFDFFIREKPEWDWGHSEDRSIFQQIVWTTRYSSIDLYKETSLKFADFEPFLMRLKLRKLGFVLNNLTKVRIADSHKLAYDEVKNLKECRVINFDAHHDLWEDKRITCGSWLYQGMKKGYVKDICWIRPSWLDIEYPDEIDLLPTSNATQVNSYSFSQLVSNQFTGIEVDTVFICRSGVWVPPHHDKAFLQMVSMFGNVEVVEPLLQRTYPTRKEAMAAIKQTKEFLRI